MALQDLTPQLRTRLNRVERAVGVFVMLATLLLFAGFVCYAYYTVKHKGWLVPKVRYYTLLYSASDLKLGDPVMLMGFPAGEITKITPNEPTDPFNVTIEFVVKKPYYGYLWTDSHVKIGGSLLGNNYLEVTKGGTSGDKEVEIKATYKDDDGPLKIWVERTPKAPGYWAVYSEWARTNRPPGFWLSADNAPTLSDKAAKLVAMVEKALPDILALTNQVAGTLNKSAGLMTSLQETIQGVQPLVSNLASISTTLSNPQGSLGDWLIPTQINHQLQGTLTVTSNTIHSAETNLNTVVATLQRSLEDLAAITGSLRDQVQANSLMLSQISSLVVDTDDLVQGLKRNWLLKKSFAEQSKAPVESLLKPGVGTKR